MWIDRLRAPRKTILVVEHDRVTRQLLSRSLAPAYHVLQAANAEEAIRIAAQHRQNIDLLVTDARLPQLSGWELLELLALDYPKLTAVYVSKSSDPEIRVQTRHQKALLVEQPFPNSGIRKAVRDALEYSQFNEVGMKSRIPSLLMRMRSYFRRFSWMHRAAS